jgi:hypothetical protein
MGAAPLFALLLSYVSYRLAERVIQQQVRKHDLGAARAPLLYLTAAAARRRQARARAPLFARAHSLPCPLAATISTTQPR